MPRSGFGLDALQRHIAGAEAELAALRERGLHRLAVDHCFSLAGVGAVVTGTAVSGRVALNDRLLVAPSGKRVRGLHAQNREASAGHAGQRLARNRAGVAKSEIERGDWIVAEFSQAAQSWPRERRVITRREGASRAAIRASSSPASMATRKPRTTTCTAGARQTAVQTVPWSLGETCARGGCRDLGRARAGVSCGASLGAGEAVWPSHTTSRQRRMAPQITPALRVGPDPKPPSLLELPVEKLALSPEPHDHGNDQRRHRDGPGNGGSPVEGTQQRERCGRF